MIFMKKLSHSLVLGIFSLLICASSSAQEYKSYMFKYGINEDSGSIILERGDVLLIGVITNGPDDFLVAKIEVEDVEVDEWLRLPGAGGYTENFKTYRGPLKLTLRHASLDKGEFIYVSTTITRASESQNKNVTGYSLVLPESTDDSYNLVLESSTDLVNWTADKTGTKGPSEKKRFYRLRAVKE